MKKILFFIAIFALSWSASVCANNDLTGLCLDGDYDEEGREGLVAAVEHRFKGVSNDYKTQQKCFEVRTRAHLVKEIIALDLQTANNHRAAVRFILCNYDRIAAKGWPNFWSEMRNVMGWEKAFATKYGTKRITKGINKAFDMKTLDCSIDPRKDLSQETEFAKIVEKVWTLNSTETVSELCHRQQAYLESIDTACSDARIASRYDVNTVQEWEILKAKIVDARAKQYITKTHTYSNNLYWNSIQPKCKPKPISKRFATLDMYPGYVEYTCSYQLKTDRIWFDGSGNPVPENESLASKGDKDLLVYLKNYYNDYKKVSNEFYSRCSRASGGNGWKVTSGFTPDNQTLTITCSSQNRLLGTSRYSFVDGGYLTAL